MLYKHANKKQTVYHEMLFYYSASKALTGKTYYYMTGLPPKCIHYVCTQKQHLNAYTFLYIVKFVSKELRKTIRS